jgi:hypothetical protein
MMKMTYRDWISNVHFIISFFFLKSYSSFPLTQSINSNSFIDLEEPRIAVSISGMPLTLASGRSQRGNTLSVSTYHLRSWKLTAPVMLWGWKAADLWSLGSSIGVPTVFHQYLVKLLWSCAMLILWLISTLGSRFWEINMTYFTPLA